ncbi:MAG: tetratricopeptide repeat protein [Pyrinomonadaceae bacterium]
MTKDNILFAIIGLLGGVIVGFMFANTVNQRAYEKRAQTVVPAQQQQQPAAGANKLPADHPELPSNAVADQGRMPPEIQSTIDRAKSQPDNFEAQLAAGELYYRIKRYPEALEYYGRASRIRPDDYEALVALGNVNFDASNFEAAEKCLPGRAAL